MEGVWMRRPRSKAVVREPSESEWELSVRVYEALVHPMELSKAGLYLVLGLEDRQARTSAARGSSVQPGVVKWNEHFTMRRSKRGSTLFIFLCSQDGYLGELSIPVGLLEPMPRWYTVTLNGDVLEQCGGHAPRVQVKLQLSEGTDLEAEHFCGEEATETPSDEEGDEEDESDGANEMVYEGDEEDEDAVDQTAMRRPEKGHPQPPAQHNEDVVFLEQCLIKILTAPSLDFRQQWRILELFKKEHGRRTFSRLFANQRRENGTFLYNKESFIALCDLVMAILREANNRKDFASARPVYESLGEFFYKGKGKTESMIDRVKDHEIWSNTRFWEELLFDDFVHMRHRMYGENQKELSAKWSLLTTEERKDLEKREHTLLLGILRVTAFRMISLNVPEESVIVFFQDAARLHEIAPNDVSEHFASIQKAWATRSAAELFKLGGKEKERLVTGVLLRPLGDVERDSISQKSLLAIEIGQKANMIRTQRKNSNGRFEFNAFEEDVEPQISRLPGEQAIATEKGTFLLSTGHVVRGRVYLTNYMLRFVVDKDDEMAYCADLVDPGYFKVPVMSIASTDKTGSGDDILVTIFCKDMRVLQIGSIRTPESNKGLKTLNKILSKLLCPKNIRHVFAFLYSPPKVDHSSNGWGVYDIETEYARMGIPNAKWRLSNANKDFKICESYPRLLAVPFSVTDQELRSIAAFRGKNRLPVCVWRHPVNEAAITRCSQPHPGLTRTRCPEDEKMLRAIFNSSANCSTLFILDARPRANAVGNMALGAGFESAEHYHAAKLLFMGIENIHHMRESWVKLRDVLRAGAQTDRTFLSSLESTQHFKHIAAILSAGVLCAELVEQKGASVIVHCSHGWDRTAQITALAQLLLDPYYRTLVGFEVLVEKEWLSFGHQFARRCGHAGRPPTDTQRSPVFAQWIDCVYQVYRQFPSSFEFNDELLTAILDHVHSCRYGTFLYDTEAERRRAGVRQHTVSLWTEINCNRQEFLNPLYVENPSVLFPSYLVRHLHLFYLRWESNENPNAIITRCGSALVQIILDLQAKLDALEQKNVSQ